MISFVKNNVLLVIGLLLSFLTIITYYIFLDSPEIFKHGALLYEALYQLSLAYIASAIFYTIVVYYPDRKKRDSISCYIERNLLMIYFCQNNEFKKLLEHSSYNPEKLDDVTKEDVVNIFKELDKSKKVSFTPGGYFLAEFTVKNSSEKTTYYRYYPEKVDIYDYLLDNVQYYKQQIRNVLNHLNYIEDDLLETIYLIEESEYFQICERIKGEHFSDSSTSWNFPRSYYEFMKLMERLKRLIT